MKKKMILSFDYELFFGDKSGTVKNSIIDPTNLLMNAMEANGFRGNFFIDYLMFQELEKQSDERAQGDIRLLKEQLNDIVRRGHRIELHLHPHWIDARYKGDGIWDFSNFEHYSLNSLKKETIKEMFVSGVSYLTDIVKETDPKYQIVAFRAGGWAVQPFDILKEAFLQVGLKIDSSVSYRTYGKNQYSSFNFMEAPNKEFWRFEDDVCKTIQNGSFIEVPISSYKRGFIYRVLDYVPRKLSKSLNPITDGTHKRVDLVEEAHPTNTYSMFTVSRLSPLSIFLSIIENRKKMVTYIDHPKDYSTSVSLSMTLMRFFYKSIFYKDLVER